MKRSLVALVILATLAAADRAHAVPVIDTTSSWNGIYSLGPFGVPFKATYGQTFLVTGPETVLDDFTFYVDDRPITTAPDVVTFLAYVAAWDGFKATGPMLFTSGPMSTSDAAAFEQFTVDTGGLALDAGQRYVAFFNTSNHYSGVSGNSRLGATESPWPYSDGHVVSSGNGMDFGLLTTQNWAQSTPNDLAFTMSFSEPIPEPATIVMLATVAVAVAAGCYRRRKNA